MEAEVGGSEPTGTERHRGKREGRIFPRTPSAADAEADVPSAV